LLESLATYFTEISIKIKMNSNQSNNSDGSFHIYLDEKPRINGKLIEKKKEKPKEVKHDKKDRK